MRRLVENRTRDFDAARKLRETFTDRSMRQVNDLGWQWPKSMDCVGACTAVMYTSDKWKRIGDYDDYKHVSESSPEQHKLLISKSFNIGVDTFPDAYAIDRMPTAVAELADILGLQYQLYDEHGKLGDQDYQVNIVRAKLGAAKHPNGETILLVYTKQALCCIITGFEVWKDGIVK